MSMKKIEWLSPDSFSLNGLLFVTSSAQKAEARGGIYTMKSPILLDLYNDRIVRSAPKCIVEVGCMGGGSAIFLNEYFDPEVVLMIDRENSTTPAFAKYLGTSPKASRLRPHLDVDQRDGATILQLVDKEFSGKRPGLIIDDASHLYEHTKLHSSTCSRCSNRLARTSSRTGPGAIGTRLSGRRQTVRGQTSTLLRIWSSRS